MSETREEQEKRSLRELEGKNVAQYSILLTAWVSTKMEIDRTFLNLSMATIVLMVTILNALGVASLYLIGLFVISFLCFGFCIWTSLKIYELNAEHLEKELRNEKGQLLNLEKYDKRLMRSFLLGVLSLCLIGIFSAYLKFNLEDKIMVNENLQKATSKSDKRSLGGIENLRPDNNQKPTVANNSSQGNQNLSQSNDKKK